MASDWRRAWTNNQWFESEVDGFARRHGQIALMPAGAVLERTIIDYQWQWRYGPTNDFDSRHFEMVLIGVHITSEDLTAPLLWPRENNSDENWIWWQYVPASHQEWRAGADNEFYSVGTAHIDTPVRRKSPGDGTQAGKVWFTIQYPSPSTQPFPIVDRSHNMASSLLFSNV
ncbi:MAG TPA: hypothetical protein VIY48_22215 [Candidatus Paceibacterota bacterium]|jgi:hypothetical protein